MMMFRTRRPRGFRHTYLYYDERRERLKTIEERAARELGLLPPETAPRDRLRGVFAGSARHLSRARLRGGSLLGRIPTVLLVFLAVVLVALVRWLY